jgi:predicted nuclease with TOPRIM domain
VDSDSWVNQFGEIEKKIEMLIETCKSQQAVNQDLQVKIKHLEEELHLKNESVRRHTEEKALIRSRIDTLLAKLEDMTRS